MFAPFVVGSSGIHQRLDVLANRTHGHSVSDLTHLIFLRPMQLIVVRERHGAKQLDNLQTPMVRDLAPAPRCDQDDVGRVCRDCVKRLIHAPDIGLRWIVMLATLNDEGFTSELLQSDMDALQCVRGAYLPLLDLFFDRHPYVPPIDDFSGRAIGEEAATKGAMGWFGPSNRASRALDRHDEEALPELRVSVICRIDDSVLYSGELWL